MICEKQCSNMEGTCPNVKEGYKFHTEVECEKCGERWLWGISWNQDRKFICPKHTDFLGKADEAHDIEKDHIAEGRKEQEELDNGSNA